MKVIFIQSVSFRSDYGEPAGKSYAYSYVHDLPLETANDFIAKGWAIPIEGWDTNPNRPVKIRFPQ